MGDAVLVLVIIVIVAWLGVYIWLQSSAKSTHATVVALAPEQVAETANKAFSRIMWKDVPGPGVINKKRRAVQDVGPVVSVHIEPAEGGGTEIGTWMSAWTSQVGLVYYAGAAVRRKRLVLKRVEAAAAEPAPQRAAGDGGR